MSKKFWMGFFMLLFLSVVVAKVYAISAIDGFNPDANDHVYPIVIQSDGKILIGGDFTKIGGQTRNYIARLNPDGTLDAAFNPNANDAVYSIVVQSDGKILVSGYFTKVGNYTRNGIARLNSDGTVDTTFNPSTYNPISRIAIQSDGKIVIGENFNLEKGDRVVRLNTNGTIDSTFNSVNANDHIQDILVQSDGEILVGGEFTSIGGQTRNRIARLTNTNASFQDISTSADGSAVIWKRSGAAPELYKVTFEMSDDMDSWTTLGIGYRTAGGWKVTNIVIPKDTNLYIRTMGCAAGGTCNGSTSIIEFVKNIYLLSEENY